MRLLPSLWVKRAVQYQVKHLLTTYITSETLLICASICHAFAQSPVSPFRVDVRVMPEELRSEFKGIDPWYSSLRGGCPTRVLMRELISWLAPLLLFNQCCKIMVDPQRRTSLMIVNS